MALVKGSKKTRVQIVEYRLRDRILLQGSLLLLAVVTAVACYYFGLKQGVAGEEKALGDIERLSKDLAFYQAEAQKYEQQFANSKLAAEVDRQASEDVRQEIISLNDEIARLREENTFYRGLMAPNQQQSGLVIDAVELVGAGQPRTYAYKVVVKQLATRHNLLSGSLKFTVHGVEAGLDKSYLLRELSSAVTTDTSKLRFKYFQVLEGQLILPEGFEPKGIELEARSTGKKPQTTRKKFGWLVEEK
ncbi:DUF6776 family protein [Agaribacterium haliotis]|uniref:DUF6776 family protein n=1 Tax=Agaribacterium haliotis TaxID=2013869 RepID=UPI001EFD1866|nr:DUF6776 family protein [Agaribacterium haliotis]